MINVLNSQKMYGYSIIHCLFTCVANIYHPVNMYKNLKAFS